MELTESEKGDLKRILSVLYGDLNVDKWKIKYEMLAVLAELVSKSKECSMLMDMVPRPSGWVPALGYVRKQLRNMARRALTHKGVYHSCAVTAALSFKSKFEIIGQGV